jgi:predicted O-methyltransferase YrrM
MQYVAGEPMNLVRYEVPIPGLPAFDADDSLWNMAEKWRKEYVVVKYSVARLLQPKRIFEIGVYSGIAALSFLAACPDAEYVGVDNLQSEHDRGIQVVSETRQVLTSLGYKNTIVVTDSQIMGSLPWGQYDLVHVDGCHTHECAKHDVILAWNALTPSGCILIDNGHDTGVCSGTFDAMRELVPGRLVNWSYLEDSVGNILIHKELL